MSHYKIILAVVAVVIGFAAYAPYIRDVFLKTTKPHTFSWIAWGVIEVTAFFAQLSKGGGAGAWVTGASAVMVLFIAGVAFTRHDTEINLFDWTAFVGALLGIIFWKLTSKPLLAVVFVSAADALAFLPTFRKSYTKPEQETLTEYGLSVIKWVLAIVALESLNITTWLYPASLVFTNSAFVAMALIRRK